jgi:hypothetical protein
MISARQSQIDAALTVYALAYKTSGLIADLVCPRVPVDVDAGKYYIFGTEPLKKYKTARAPKSDPNYMERTLSTDTFSCAPHSLAGKLDDKDRKAAPFNLRENTVQGLIEAMSIDWEIQVASLFCTYTNYASGNYGNPAIQFNSGSGPDMEKLIDDASKVVRDACGVAPNTLIIPYDVAMVMKRMSQIQEQRGKGMIDLTQTEGLPPNLWGKKVLIAGAQYDSAKEGQTPSFSNIWGDYMILAYINPSAGWMDMAFAKNFSLSNANGLTRYVETEMLRSSQGGPFNCEHIEVFEDGRDSKIVCDKAAYLWSDCLA